MPNRRVAIVKQRCLGHSNSMNTRSEGGRLGTQIHFHFLAVTFARAEDNNTGSRKLVNDFQSVLLQSHIRYAKFKTELYEYTGI